MPICEVADILIHFPLLCDCHYFLECPQPPSCLALLAIWTWWRLPLLNNPFWHCPSGSVLYLPLVLIPACLGLLGNLTAMMQTTGNLWGLCVIFYVCGLSFFFYRSIYPLHPCWNGGGYFRIFAFLPWGPPGAKQSSFSHTKGKRPGYLPFSMWGPYSPPFYSALLILEISRQQWGSKGKAGEASDPVWATSWLKADCCHQKQVPSPYTH